MFLCFADGLGFWDFLGGIFFFQATWKEKGAVLLLVDKSCHPVARLCELLSCFSDSSTVAMVQTLWTSFTE